MKLNIGERLSRYRRVLILARKPDKKELKETARICGMGFMLMGLIGFIIYLISVLGGS
jgi:protein translocase SEC61 complex gamma subunit